MIDKIIQNKIQSLINDKAPDVIKEINKLKTDNPPTLGELPPVVVIGITGEGLNTKLLLKVLYFNERDLKVSRVIYSGSFLVSDIVNQFMLWQSEPKK